MPQHKSNKKRLLTAEKSRLRNRHVRSTILTSLKTLNNSETKQEAQGFLKKFFSLLDNAARKHQGNFTFNKVARFKAKGHKIVDSKA